MKIKLSQLRQIIREETLNASSTHLDENLRDSIRKLTGGHLGGGDVNTIKKQFENIIRMATSIQQIKGDLNGIIKGTDISWLTQKPEFVKQIQDWLNKLSSGTGTRDQFMTALKDLRSKTTIYMPSRWDDFKDSITSMHEHLKTAINDQSLIDKWSKASDQRRKTSQAAADKAERDRQEANRPLTDQEKAANRKKYQDHLDNLHWQSQQEEERRAREQEDQDRAKNPWKYR